MIARTVDAGDNFKKRASIPLAPCNLEELDQLTVLACKSSQQSVLSLVPMECFFSMCLKVLAPSSVVVE